MSLAGAAAFKGGDTLLELGKLHFYGLKSFRQAILSGTRRTCVGRAVGDPSQMVICEPQCPRDGRKGGRRSALVVPLLDLPQGGNRHPRPLGKLSLGETQHAHAVVHDLRNGHPVAHVQVSLAL